jgi:predicted membrane-bound spermidine synthase
MTRRTVPTRDAQYSGQRLGSEIIRTITVMGIPASVALVSAALMISEIALTRLFSVLLSYSFVYVLLSVAILGLGLGALVAHWKHERLRGPDSLVTPLLVAALSILVLTSSLVVTASRHFWFLYLLLSCVPFALAGMFLSQVFAEKVEQSGWLYWADLTGAGLGVPTTLAALTAFGPINALLLAALLLAAGSLLYFPERRLSRSVALFLGLLLAINLGTGIITLDLSRSESAKTIALALDSKGLDGEVVFSDWDAFARTDVVTYPGLPDERTVFVDGGAGSPMLRMEDGIESLGYLRNDMGFLPFRLIRPESVLVIGPGGGKDIAFALLGGSHTITAVEINPGVVRALDSLSNFNGGLHRHPAVDLHIGEGRSFLKSKQRTYNLIYLSLVANEAADLSGLALAENYIYTEEAFLDYLSHLEPDGAVALRLHDEPHLQRAFVTALKALTSTGLSTSQAMKQILVLAGLPDARSPARMDPMLLILASPLLPSQANTILDSVTSAGVFPLFVPHEGGKLPYLAFAQGKIQIEEFVSRLGNSYARPTTDDRPFFYLLQGGLPKELCELVVLLGLATVGWALYVLFHRDRHTRKEFWVFGAYFAIIGAGFMLIEIALIQRFTLFLGHPVRSLSVVLGGLLVSSGLGSLATRRVKSSTVSLIRWGSLGVVLLSGFYLILLPGLLSGLLGASLRLRLLLTLGLILPLGLLLGIPFPCGLRLLASRQCSSSVALAWATNGLFSVVGSVLAVVIAIQFGFAWSWVTGATAYSALAGLVWVSISRSKGASGIGAR